MEELTEKMKHISDRTKIREVMKDTARYRWDMIQKKDGPDVAEVLTKFPHILEEGMVGYL